MFDWERILFNNATSDFLLEVVLRSATMFIVLLVVLKLAGKRGIKQLSIFELVMIISLGSAAGDPMFYEDVGIIHGAIVLVVVLLLYRGITWLTGKSPRVEKLLEGEPECLLNEGKLTKKQFAKEGLAQDEFFSELRLRNVEHLGQVSKAYLETSGDISVFYFDDNDAKPGLPILPELFKNQLAAISEPGLYACCRCGDVGDLSAGKNVCRICAGMTWVAPMKSRRIT